MAANGSGSVGGSAGAGGAPVGRDWVIRVVAVGAVAGFFSAMFGVGGGIVIVPLLIAWLAFDAKIATATSLASILLTATAGAVTHGGLGNVDLAVAALIGIPAVGGVWLGNELKRRLSTRALTLAFATVLVAVAVGMAATA